MAVLLASPAPGSATEHVPLPCCRLQDANPGAPLVLETKFCTSSEQCRQQGENEVCHVPEGMGIGAEPQVLVQNAQAIGR